MNAVRSLLRGVTWSNCLIAAALGIGNAIDKWHYWVNEQPRPPDSWFEWTFCASCLGAVSILIAAIRADDAAARGTPPLLAHVLALCCAMLVTVVAATLVVAVGIEHRDIRFDLIAVQRRGRYVEFIENFVLCGGMVLLFNYNKGAAARILARLQATESLRVLGERQLLESRLAAAEAQLEPAILLRSLAQIRSDYVHASPEAEEKLDQLIRDLRVSLARMVPAGAPQAHAP